MAKDNLCGILDYIRAQMEEFNLGYYTLEGASPKWHKDFEGLPDVVVGNNGTWIKIKRQKNQQPPALPEELTKYQVTFSTTPSKSPTFSLEKHRSKIERYVEDRLRDKKLVKSAEKDAEEDLFQVRLKEDIKNEIERLEKMFDVYLKEKYWPWWEKYEPFFKTNQLYNHFFHLRNTLTNSQGSTEEELVLGYGVARTTLSVEGASKNYLYPILTQRVGIRFDEAFSEIEIYPINDEPSLEFDAFVKTALPNSIKQEDHFHKALKQRQGTEENVYSFWEDSFFEDIIKRIPATLYEDGVFVKIRSEKEKIPSDVTFTISDEWVIFQRKVQSHYIKKDIEALREVILKSTHFAEGVSAFVLPPSNEKIDYPEVNFTGVSSRGENTRDPSKSKELYFPLPYNAEQEHIVRLLERGRGAVVQGPPGTGKTHTIVNILCHYLAQGKKVLITSHGPNALRVIRDKVPESIRSLAVTFLDDDSQSKNQFVNAIRHVQENLTKIDEHAYSLRIQNHRASLHRFYSDIASIDNEIEKIAREHFQEYLIQGKSHSAWEMTEWAIKGKNQYSWFSDSIDFEVHPPIDSIQERELRDARRKVGSDICYLGLEIPSLESLPPLAELSKIRQCLIKQKDLLFKKNRGELTPLCDMSSETMAKVPELIEVIDQGIDIFKAIEHRLEGRTEHLNWVWKLRVDLSKAQSESLLDAFLSLTQSFRELKEARKVFLTKPVKFPSYAFNNPKLQESIKRAVETGKPLGFFSSLGNKEIKEFLGGILVCGLPPKTIEDWSHIEVYQQTHIKLTQFVSRWNSVAQELGIPSLESDLSNGIESILKKIEDYTEIIFKVRLLSYEWDLQFDKKKNRILERTPWGEICLHIDSLSSLKNDLEQQIQLFDLERFLNYQQDLILSYQKYRGAFIDELLEFFKIDLSNEYLSQEEFQNKYHTVYHRLQELHNLQPFLQTIQVQSQSIEESGALNFALTLRTQVCPNNGDDLHFQSEWRDAWEWKRVYGKVEDILNQVELETLFEKRAEMVQILELQYQDFISDSAWLNLKKNTTQSIMSDLFGFVSAVGRLTKGRAPSSKNELFSRLAKDLMQGAKDAIPCWIMPHQLVSQNFPATLNAFDLVIVDEASQSDIKSFPAIIRGKKILIVGDDRQVSPGSGKFISNDRVQELYDRYLQDQPFKTDMFLGQSLYDLAVRVFSDQNVALKEHFRCVSPIIGFSNKNYYADRIVPLRSPKASERLDPPLIDVFVKNGFRDKHEDININEANFIAEEIVAILKDPKCRKKTIGVVTLLGSEGAQANLIDSKVRDACIQENLLSDLMERNFSCGDPRIYQGSERDIIFISLVVDRENCRALSGKEYQQRFNVAASRARDRMYLVRSVTINDLSETDERRKLLIHYSQASTQTIDTPEELLTRCQSEFEKAFFRFLHGKGYKVIPQYPVGAFRIDLVIEDEDKRLAIELDGDRFHGPAQWPQDLARQAILERAGWTFWRCFASKWEAKTEMVYEELLKKLESLNIRPLNYDTVIAKEVEIREYEFKDPDALQPVS